MTIVDVRAPRSAQWAPAHHVGAKVAVRNRYLGTWSAGFEVVALHRDGYRIKRASDGGIIAEVIPFRDVREPFDSVSDPTT